MQDVLPWKTLEAKKRQGMEATYPPDAVCREDCEITIGIITGVLGITARSTLDVIFSQPFMNKEIMSRLMMCIIDDDANDSMNDVYDRRR